MKAEPTKKKRERLPVSAHYEATPRWDGVEPMCQNACPAYAQVTATIPDYASQGMGERSATTSFCCITKQAGVVGAHCRPVLLEELRAAKEAG